MSERALRSQKSASNDVYSTLQSWLMDGRIAPGAKLNIERLARELGVSATPVREAIGRLEGDNLVVTTPGRGPAATARLSFEEFRQLYEFRLLVEPWAARSVAVGRLINPARMLTDELAEFERALASGTPTRETTFAHDARFHSLIMEATENSWVRQSYWQTHCHLHIYRLEYTGNSAGNTADEHKAIAEAIHRCDPDAAAEAASEHLRLSYARSVTAFRDSGS
ncbi:MAG: GntR family transcriptional regulator [Propionibacteriaceae bacterium]|nr:GntR family transcriptional regulator [Propionibacteriaceae bacterium]